MSRMPDVFKAPVVPLPITTSVPGPNLLQDLDRYKGQPPPGLEVFKLSLVLSTICYSELDMRSKDTVDHLIRVSTACKVWIDVRDAHETQTITLWAEERQHLISAIKAIRAHLSLEGEGRGIYRPVILIKPPSVARDAFKVTLHKTVTGRLRAVAELDVSAPAATPDEVEVLQKAHAEGFRKSFDQVASVLKKIPNEMRMRLHFGGLELTQSQKNRTEYNCQEFDRFTRQLARRGCTMMNLNIGNEKFVDQLLQKVFVSDNLFIPAVNRTPTLKDTIPKQSLVLFTKKYRLESQIQGVSSHQARRLVCGQPRAFQRTRNKEIEITTICPEEKYDWKLEVLTESTRLPSKITSMTSKIQFGEPEGQDCFPTPSLPAGLIAGDPEQNVYHVAGKTTWRFQMADGPYFVEVSLYREWEETNTILQPRKYCGIVFFAEGWDDEMRVDDLKSDPRDWGEQHGALFAPTDEQDGFAAFLQQVRKLQEFIGDIQVVEEVGQEEAEQVLADKPAQATHVNSGPACPNVENRPTGHNDNNRPAGPNVNNRPAGPSNRATPGRGQARGGGVASLPTTDLLDDIAETVSFQPLEAQTSRGLKKP